MTKFSGTNKVTVSAPLRQALKKCLDDETKIFANKVFNRYLYPYTPYVTGTMAETVEFYPDGIHYDAKYASRNYDGVGLNFSKENHPLAQAKWGEVAGKIHGSAIARKVEDYVKANKLR